MEHTARIQSLLVGGLIAALTLYGYSTDAAGDFARAKPHGRAGCPAGTFLDVGRGECWRCPKDTNRTVLAVDTAGACERPAYTAFDSAKQYGRGTGPLKTDCPKGQFWDPNGNCYSCPTGYGRTAAPVTGAKACSRTIAAVRSKATFIQKHGCPAGSFLDVGRGDCWSCASGWFRTIGPVTGDKACANKLENIFAVDTTATCTQVITALREGEKGVQRFVADMEKVIDPVVKSANDSMRKLSDQIGTPAELDKLLDDLGRGLRPYSNVVDEVQRLSNQLDKVSDQLLQGVLLNPDVMCRGTPSQIDQKLAALGLRPKLRIQKSGLLDHVIVGNAYAATKEQHVGLAVSGTYAVNPTVRLAFAMTTVTNFAGRGGVFFSSGLATPAGPPASVSVGIYIFPSVDISEFEGIQALAAEISIDSPDILEKLYKKAGRSKGAVSDSFNVSFDPVSIIRGAPGVPGLGVSKEIAFGKKKGGSVARTPSPSGTVPVPVPPPVKPPVSGTFDITFKIVSW